MSFFAQQQKEVLFKLHGHQEEYEETISFLQDSLAGFISRDLAPHAAEHDEREHFAVDIFHKLGELGFLAMSYPEEYGGLSLPFTFYCAGLESLAKGDAGFTLGVAIHGTVCDGIFRFASEEQKKIYLPELISGKKIACFCLSEPGSGSDAQSMATSYRYDPDADEYILNGAKFWITNGLSADVFFVLAVGEHGNISAFLVEKGGAGEFQQNKIADKMGVRGSNTAELVFNDYRIPAKSLVGEEGRGFKYAMEMLNGGRITIASWSTGIAQGAYEKLLKYANERKLFNRYLKDLDNTKKEFSEMMMEICAGRELSYNAAYYKNSPSVARHAAIAKVKATEVAVYVSERAIELAGGYGYLKESKIERHLRDALLGRIGEGANEVLKIMVIPRMIYDEFAKKPITESW